MAVLACPHCGSVLIIVGGHPTTGLCQQGNCRGVLAQLVEPEAGTAIRKAFYAHDHGLELDGAIVPLGRL
jgi:hypothetical protein